MELGKATAGAKARGLGAPPERKLSKDASVSLWIHFCYSFGASMSGVFLNLYLWRLTQSLWVNGMYNIIGFSVTVASFFVGGWLSKRKDRLYTYRIGIVLTAAFYLCVILAGERVAEWYVWFAVFSGLAGGFYWTGYLVLMYDVSDDKNRIHYLAMNTIFFTAAGLVGPALAGKIISVNNGLQGYMIVFGVAFGMYVLASLGSLRIGPSPAKHKAYYMKYAVRMMNREKRWLYSLFAFFLYGLMNGIMLFLPNILLYSVLPKEEWIGYLGMLFAGLTIFTGTLISKYAKPDKARLYLTVAALGIITASSILLFNRSAWSIIGFMVVYSLFAPLQGNSMTSHYYRMMGSLPLKGQFRIESVVVRELFLNAGRVVSIFMLISLSGSMEGNLLPWVLLGGAAIQLAVPLFVRGARP